MPHEGMGMLGTVVVGEPDLEHEAGMEPPQDELPQAAQEKIKELNAKVEKMLGDENHEDDHNHHHGEESGHKDGHGEHG
ncbi:MAG: hypothetical protein ABEI52_08465, partial [Halobacteriaceae archaeon]